MTPESDDIMGFPVRIGSFPGSAWECDPGGSASCCEAEPRGMHYEAEPRNENKLCHHRA
ncbi:hypothetical protein DENIS_2526 [Desulfonema ishimotonii]|uniref:Uncharacterized protein n=1 Tax=Desulfonema ishimotonii TaxID=45657 RepID=A0A401FXA6_9BACT|nr:hypothetical protein DENIS_2526 [Desulfonema ishimotonii]